MRVYVDGGDIQGGDGDIGRIHQKSALGLFPIDAVEFDTASLLS